MTETETRRKLTTIMSADVQDYSRMMGVDEEGTLATLQRYRDSMRAVIGLHGGRVVNTWGDGLIAEFPSVVEALRAAIDIQNDIAGRNEPHPAERRMQFRIGINLGDVIEQDNDIYGDGVNIAARLQSQAEPGGIVISNTVYDQVRNKVAVAFDFLGPLSVKNINEAIPSYAVRVGDTGHAHQKPSDATPSQPPMQEQFGRVARDSTPPRRIPFSNRIMGFLGVASAIVLVINLLTWQGEFWARWPVMGMAIAAALIWSRSLSGRPRTMALAIIAAATIVTINLFSWHGEFWAQWPLLAIAIAAALGWVLRRS
ncbi:adenylate/guanylate cyclase domain-containing protein [Rhizobium sp. TH2]|uniref:adenylate/guanylate cyclase domain-containing protein n=1 Tax=Rhizobium sp. TH2 TaxID=2775403 RepID=UPI0021575ED6|nr:adenylate/guanylate cyclase domain-containing protein [Rhizobium sp. TH2]UVC08894.1 adenylate/guanylate cyclase domain-containing protein [Rhizobium sp. TH2]